MWKVREGNRGGTISGGCYRGQSFGTTVCNHSFQKAKYQQCLDSFKDNMMDSAKEMDSVN